MVVKNMVTPKWLALVNGNLDYNLRSLGGVILTHTHIQNQKTTQGKQGGSTARPQETWATKRLLCALAIFKRMPHCCPVTISYPVALVGNKPSLLGLGSIPLSSGLHLNLQGASEYPTQRANPQQVVPKQDIHAEKQNKFLCFKLSCPKDLELKG